MQPIYRLLYRYMNIVNRSLFLLLGLAGALRAADSLVMVLSFDQKALIVFRQEGNSLSPAANIPVGDGAREFCLSADGMRAYVSNEKANTITAIDLDSMKVIATIEPPNIKRPDGCATSADSKKLYVAGLGSGDLTIIDVNTSKVIKQIPLGEETRRIIRSPEGDKLYIASEGAGIITVFDPRGDKVLSTFKAGGQGPRAMQFLSDGKTMLNLNVDDDTMSFIDVTAPKVNMTIGVGGAPQRVVLSHDGKYVYVLASLEDKISIIDLSLKHIRAGKFVPAPHQPVSMILSRDGSTLFVTSRAENAIVAYDLATMKIAGKTTVPGPMGVLTR